MVNKCILLPIRDNNAFFVQIMSTLKAIKISFERSYDKQNITLVVISYNDHECNILYISIGIEI